MYINLVFIYYSFFTPSNRFQNVKIFFVPPGDSFPTSTSLPLQNTGKQKNKEMHTPQFNFTQYPSGKEGLGFIDIRSPQFPKGAEESRTP